MKDNETEIVLILLLVSCNKLFFVFVEHFMFVVMPVSSNFASRE